jgi:hypothetical protein
MSARKNADQFAAAITHQQRPSVAANLLEQSIFFVLPRTRAFSFLSQEIFLRPKK